MSMRYKGGCAAVRRSHGRGDFDRADTTKKLFTQLGENRSRSPLADRVAGGLLGEFIRIRSGG